MNSATVVIAATLQGKLLTKQGPAWAHGLLAPTLNYVAQLLPSCVTLACHVLPVPDSSFPKQGQS